MKWFRTFAATALALIIAALPVAGLAEGEEGAKIDPKAEKTIRSMAEYVKGLKAYRFDLDAAMKMESEGMKQEMTTSYAFAVQKPNKLAMVLTKGMMGATLVCDGKSVYTYMPIMGKYTVEEAPDSLENLAEENETWAMSAGSSMGGLMLVDSFITADPGASIMEGVLGAEYVGETEIAGAKCHHLKFIQEELDWEAWIEVGKKPLLRQIKPDMSKAFAEMADAMPHLKNMKMEFVISLNNWDTSGDIPADLFVFTPPEKAEKVDSFMAAMGQPEKHKLEGEPAPVFTLELLDGGEMDLAKHKGKDVVILDFWATWCAPCVKAMPVLAEVADEFKDRGVVLYAVNQRESSERIKAFLEKRKLDTNVALDSKGTVGDLYGVRGIPQTVIIDKSGKIAKVHIGFTPGLKKELTKELEALVTGKRPPAAMAE